MENTMESPITKKVVEKKANKKNDAYSLKSNNR